MQMSFRSDDPAGVSIQRLANPDPQKQASLLEIEKISFSQAYWDQNYPHHMAVKAAMDVHHRVAFGTDSVASPTTLFSVSVDPVTQEGRLSGAGIAAGVHPDSLYAPEPDGAQYADAGHHFSVLEQGGQS